MIEKLVLNVGDAIKVEFENFLGELIVVNGIVRRIDDLQAIVGNDVTDGIPFFVSMDEILEVNHQSVLPSTVLKSLKEVS